MRGIRPGRERLFRRLAVSGFFTVPAYAVFLAAAYALQGPSAAQMSLLVAALFSGVFVFCGQWAVLTEENKPLLSAWLRIASLGTWVLMYAVFSLAAYLWLGWIAVACAPVLISLGAANVYSAGRRAPD